MRKTGILLILALLLSVAPTGVALSQEYALNSYYDDIFHLKNIGILQGEGLSELAEDDIVTRSEFAVMIFKLLGAEDGAQNLRENIFSDIPDDHWARDAINYCGSLGIISGTGAGLFMPNAPAEGYHAMKILVELLGYGYKAKSSGGYPAGYYSVSKALGLLRGVDLSGEGILMRDLARMCSNALTVNLNLETGISGNDTIYTTQNGETVLTKYHKLNTMTGVLDGTFEVTIAGNQSLDKNQISISKAKFNGWEGMVKYLGMQVRIFYTIDEDIPTIVSILPVHGKNNLLYIDASKVAAADSSKITYETSASRESTVSIPSSIKLVYNLSYVMDYDFSLLPSFGSGGITLIDNNQDGSYDVGIIVNYETYVVSGISSKSIRGRANVNAIIIDDENKTLNITDSDGNPLTVDDIGENTVLFAIVTGKAVAITVSKAVVTGTVISLSSDEILIDETLYELSKDSILHGISPGTSVTAYLDPYGRVAYLRQGGSKDKELGYLIMLKQGESSLENCYGKLLNEKGQVVVYPLSDKIIINSAGYSTYDQYDDLIDLMSADGVNFQPQLVKYRIEEDSIREMEIYSGGDDGFILGYGALETGTVLKYTEAIGTLGGKVNVSDLTKVFLVPDKSNAAAAANEDYAVTERGSLKHEQDYSVCAYYSSIDNELADAIVVFGNLNSLSKITYDTLMYPYVDKTVGIGRNGRRAVMMKYFDGRDIQAVEVAEELEASLSYQSGDVIRFAISSDNIVTEITPIYLRSSDTLQFTTNPSVSAFNSSVRFACGYVNSMSDNRFRLSIDGVILNDVTKLALDSYNIDPVQISPPVLIINEANGRKYYSKGAVNDLEIGDFVVIQQRTGRVRMIIVYKC